MDGEIRSRPSTPAYREGWDRIFKDKVDFELRMKRIADAEKSINEMVKRINALTDEELDSLIKKDQCPFQPELIPSSMSLGMFHCEVCGEMIVSGVPHPRRSAIDNLDL